METHLAGDQDWTHKKSSSRTRMETVKTRGMNERTNQCSGPWDNLTKVMGTNQTKRLETSVREMARGRDEVVQAQNQSRDLLRNVTLSRQERQGLSFPILFSGYGA